jgi:hypothetical protein
MPSVSCEHFTDGGVNSKGCRGLFKSTSVGVRSGNCNFYGVDFCGSLDIVGGPAECRNTAELLAGPGDFIRSFRCVSARYHYEGQMADALLAKRRIGLTFLE